VGNLKTVDYKIGECNKHLLVVLGEMNEFRNDRT